MTKPSIDEKIKQALASEDAEIYEQFAEEPSLLAQGLELLQSRNRLINGVVVVVMFVFLGLGAYSIWQFSLASEIKVLIGWAMSFGFSMAAVSMLKLWAWMEIEKNCTVREIKRLELQVARLAQRLDESKS